VYDAPPAVYGAAAPATYGATTPTAYGTAALVADGKKSNKMGMGDGADCRRRRGGVLRGLALAGGASLLENKLEERVSERVGRS
jgi:hypothetical protein